MSFAPVSTFMPGMICGIDEGFNDEGAILLLLPDCFVVKDRAADRLTQTGRGHNQLPISAPGFLVLGNPPLGKSLVTVGLTFIHRQQSLCRWRPSSVQY